MTWTIRDALVWTRDHFAKKNVDAPRLTAEVLLAHALVCDRVKLYTEHDRPLHKDELARFRGFIERRLAGEPTQYIVGVREFYGRPFKVDRRVFIPRPETEQLCALALEALPAQGARALDLCTGSGAVAITLAAERPGLEVDAVELSPQAADVARENAQALAPGRVQVHVGDLFAALPQRRRYRAITANPPYISEGDTLPREVVDHEPRVALFAGPEGLDVIRRIAAGLPSWLESGGLFAMEIEETQGERAAALLRDAGLTRVRVHADTSGLDRVVTATLE